MIKFLKKNIIVIVWALLIIAVSVVYSLFNSSAALDYCKNIICYGDGIAAIQENDYITSIITADKNGRLKDRINVINADYLNIKVKSFDTLFKGTDGTLYVLGRIFSDNSPEKVYVVYSCNTELGILKESWVLENDEEYSLFETSIPYVDNGRLYINYTNKASGNIVLMEIDENNSRKLVSQSSADKNNIEKTVAVNGKTAVLKLYDGVFYEGKQLVPESSAESIWNGLNYENGMLNFGDINNNIVYHYNVENDTLRTEHISDVDFGLCQSIRFYADGSMTASYENEGVLQGIYSSGGESTIYKCFDCGFQWKFFLQALLVCAVVSLVLWLLYRFFIVRFRKNRLNENKRVKIIRISTKIIAISILITTIVTVFFVKQIDEVTEETSLGWFSTNRMETLQIISSNITNQTSVTDAGGIPKFTEESYSFLVNNSQAMFDELLLKNGGQDYNLTVITEYKGDLYCLFSNKTKGTVPAQMEVSTSVLESFEETIKNQTISEYEDKRSVGLMSYIIFPLEMQDGRKIAAAISANAYVDKINFINIQRSMYIMIFGLSAALLIFLNVVLRIMLRRARTLEKAMNAYTENGDGSSFGKIKGNDEIAQTAQALEQMSKGLEIYTNDLCEGNRNYRRLLPNGILELMGEDGISNVSVGTYRSTEGMLVRFKLNRLYPVNAQLEQIISFCNENDGHVMFMNSQRLDAFFENKAIDKTLSENFLAYDTMGISVYRQFGKIDAGSVGDVSNAYLVACSKQFSQLEKIELKLDNMQKTTDENSKSGERNL